MGEFNRAHGNYGKGHQGPEKKEDSEQEGVREKRDENGELVSYDLTTTKQIGNEHLGKYVKTRTEHYEMK